MDDVMCEGHADDCMLRWSYFVLDQINEAPYCTCAAPAQPSQAGLSDREVLFLALVETQTMLEDIDRTTSTNFREVRERIVANRAILASIRSSVGEVELAARAIAQVQACHPDSWRHFADEARAALTAISGGPHADASKGEG